MAAVELEHLHTSAPTARVLEFTSNPTVFAHGWKPVHERLSITPGITPASPIPLSPASIDRFLSEVAQHYGHDPRQLVGAAIGVQVCLAWAHAPDRAVTLNVTIQHERHGPGFTSRANVSQAFGSGDTIGEAFVDCVDDFMERSRVLEAEQERLGPGPQREREEIQRRLGSAS